MITVNLRRSFLAFLALALAGSTLAFAPAATDTDVDGGDGASPEIISRYLQATQNPYNDDRGGSVQVDIDASVPHLQKQGHLKALKIISRLGKTTYHVLSFQGDNTVKKEIIARYLQADQQGQQNSQLAVTPVNYKFRFRGARATNAGTDVYVYQLSPRKKAVGLFKGELWIDTRTYLPVFEKGRLVKSPSFFLKHVDFEREYAIRDGRAVPEHVSSTIHARLIGTVQLTVDYSNFSSVSDAEPEDLHAAMIKAN